MPLPDRGRRLVKPSKGTSKRLPGAIGFIERFMEMGGCGMGSTGAQSTYNRLSIFRVGLGILVSHICVSLGGRGS